ncbi:MAG: transglycosylase domain-containing protein [Anaerolineae bacterium]|nr:transglycosylase domain-containing protein [Anaerolineae bacterium]
MSYPPQQPYPPYQTPPPPQGPPPQHRRGKRGRRQRRPATPSPGYAMPPVMPGQPPYGSPNRARRRRRGIALGPGIILGCVGIVGVLMLAGMLTLFLVYNHYSNRLEDEIDRLEELTSYQSFETTVIYDGEGGELYQVIGEGRRTRISLDQIPQHMIEATIAIEDDTFYENRGVDLPSIARAAWQYVRYGYIVSGGSTITQQLIRNVLFTDEYKYELSLNRKMDEALLAVILTQCMSKDEILELYLNEIPYGNLAYGVEAAAQTYFGKPASALTLGEAALLASLPQAPAELDPLNPDANVQRRVMERRRLVLDRMVEENYISRQEANAAFAEPLNFVSPDIALDSAPHFVVYVQSQLASLPDRVPALNADLFRRELARGGLQVYTTVNMDIQRLAESIASTQVAQLKAAHNMNNAAVVVIRPDTGEILAMVGSVDFDDESIDGQVNVTTARRQPGSAMKPFTYAAAFEHGWNAATVIWDVETRIPIPGQPDYVPVNYDRAYHGPVRLREALANSYNIPAVQTLRQVGVEYLIWLLNRVGVTSLSSEPGRYGLSLTLGGGEVSPLELTTAFATLANGGVYVPTQAIACVTNSSGEILYEYQRRCPSDARLTDRSVSVLIEGQQVLDPRIAFIISHILADNDARTPAMGARSPLYTPGIPTSVKTGTTNDFRDNWTVGFTRNIAVGVWAGNTDNAEMFNISGLDGAAPIWGGVMTGIYNTPGLLDQLGSRSPDDAHLQPPGGVQQRQICNISRTALHDPATTCQPGIFEWFLDGPAAIPDVSGNLVAPAPTSPPPVSANGPQPVEVEPGLIRVHVFPVETNLANAIAAADSSGKTVPPRYCQVPIEIAGAIPGVSEQLFIVAPPVPEDAFYARLWAQSNGVAILPQYACNEQMLTAGPPQASGGAPGVTAYISAPVPGQTYPAGQQIDIIGTAAFSPGAALFYKVEIRGGPFGDWTTLGDVNNWRNRNGVSDGVLESIMSGGVPPGGYQVQLVIVGPDGNILTTAGSSFNVG